MTTTIANELESLLRGEIAAAETYQQALDGREGEDEEGVATLRQIQREHGEAIRFLYEQLDARRDDPPATSGMWGGVARAIEGTAKLFGNRAAMRALREGEALGLQQYERTLKVPDLPTAVRDKIVTELLPAQRRHIQTLDHLIAREG